MKDSERFKLHGTYTTPLVRRGMVLTCEDRDCDVVVMRLSDGRIPWPIGRKRGYKHGAGGFILFGALADAVRTESNQAVAYWWGVRIEVVSRWRRALGIRYTNSGTYKLREGYTHAKWFKHCRRKGVARAQDPEVKKQRADSYRGRNLPRSHVNAIRRAKSNISAETRAKISTNQKERFKHVALNGKIFTPEEDAIIRTHSAAEAIKLTGRTAMSIYSRRRVLGIAANPDFTPEDDKIIRARRPSEAARLTGRTMPSIYARRFQLGITARRGPR